MKPLKTVSTFLVNVAIVALIGCSTNAKAPDVSSDVRKALNQVGLNDVTVRQDRDKGVVTLSGKVATDDEKARAESITRSIAGGQVVSDEIGVRLNGDKRRAQVKSILNSIPESTRT